MFGADIVWYKPGTSTVADKPPPGVFVTNDTKLDELIQVTHMQHHNDSVAQENNCSILSSPSCLDNTIAKKHTPFVP